MKYIIFEGLSGNKYPIVFPETLVHSEVAGSIVNSFPEPTTVKSAGYCGLFAICGEGSETLKVVSHEDDSLIVSFGESFSHMDINQFPYVKKVLEEKHRKITKAIAEIKVNDKQNEQGTATSTH